MVAALLLSIAGLMFLLWLIVTLAICALPFYAGLSAAIFAWHHNAGIVGAGLAGLLTGIGVLAVGQFLFAMLRSPWARALVAGLYAAPAGVAGWHAVHSLFRLAGTGEPWCSGFAWIGSLVIAGIAWMRVTALQPEIEAARQRGQELGRRALSEAQPMPRPSVQPPEALRADALQRRP